MNLGEEKRRKTKSKKRNETKRRKQNQGRKRGIVKELLNIAGVELHS